VLVGDEDGVRPRRSSKPVENAPGSSSTLASPSSTSRQEWPYFVIRMVRRFPGEGQVMGIMRKVGFVGAAVSFARSSRGQQLIADARRRYDTPANREWAKQGFQQVRQQVSSRRGAPRPQ